MNHPLKGAAWALALRHGEMQARHGATHKTAVQWADDHWRDHLWEAATVVSALRRASREQEMAIERLADESGAQFDIAPEVVWRTMIDALLGETGNPAASHDTRAP